MKDRFKIAVVGGDKRQELLAELLAAGGQLVYYRKRQYNGDVGSQCL